MKSLFKGLIVFAIALTVITPVKADTDVEITGQIRLREEVDGKVFDTSNAILNFADLRTRVGIKATIDDNTHAFIQLQDSRRMGGYDQFGQPASGGQNDGKNVDMHQAYFLVDNLGIDGLGMKAGRFELALGNERVFGAVGWSNIGRSWDGAMGWYDHPKFRATGFGLKGLERNNPYYNADLDIGGGYVTLKDYKLDLFSIYEYDADTTGNYYNLNQLERYSFGAYATYASGQFDLEANGVYQAGQKVRGPYNPWTGENKIKDNIQAFMFAAEAGVNLEQGTTKIRLAAGLDYTSGDDDLDDDTYKAYDNLFYTGHKFQGYMDYFTNVKGKAYENAGLTDIILRVRVEPNADWTANLDAHLFSTSADYVSQLDDTTLLQGKDVGIELDADLATTYIKGINIKAGGSVFFAKEAFAGVRSPDPTFWLYSMMTANF